MSERKEHAFRATEHQNIPPSLPIYDYKKFNRTYSGKKLSEFYCLVLAYEENSNHPVMTHLRVYILAGELVGTCEGPHGTTVPVQIEHLGPDTVQCIVTPRSAGPHSLSLLFGGFPLPSSPFHGLTESGGTGVRVILTGKGLASATCGQQAEFTIDGSQAGPGIPEVTLTGVKHDIDVSLQMVGSSVYKATYTPVNPGAYLLNVMWSER